MNRLPSSFRDPNGFVFYQGERLLRQVNLAYREDYDTLRRSGLYDELVDSGLLIPHQELPDSFATTEDAYRVLEPTQLPIISYPYEWCFSQLKDAALTTLLIEKRALHHGMTLKDASAYNIQFHEGRPVLIDTLSFERLREGDPWVAYRQFCQHFLAPLSLMSHVDIRLARLLERFLDGIPLDLASHLLPRRTWIRPSLGLHLHLHARSIRRYSDATRERVERSRKLGPKGLEGLIDHLESAITRLDWSPEGTEWIRYESTHGYPDAALRNKRDVVTKLMQEILPNSVWDLGSNTGLFSQLATFSASHVLSIDHDPGAVEIHYRRLKGRGERRVLPLWMDLTNPSPSVGWAHRERDSLVSRGPADLVLALALIHHLAISNNTPLQAIAELLSHLGRSLIVEFIPKSDAQVQRLLVSRRDVFPAYSQTGFERAFSHYFRTIRSWALGDTGRSIYYMIKIER